MPDIQIVTEYPNYSRIVQITPNYFFLNPNYSRLLQIKLFSEI